MKAELAKLFERLETEGVGVMPEVYALTSPHLFGIITGIVSDGASAERILKSVYSQIWDRRGELGKHCNNDPLSYVRRLAHRMAIDYKFESGAEFKQRPDLSNFQDIEFSNAESSGISIQNLRILRLAYLHGASISEISDIEQLDIEQVRSGLDEAMACLRRSSS